MTNKDRLLDKLAKLKATQEGEAKLGNTAAAEAFAAAINRLLLEHELSMEEVQSYAERDTDPIVRVGLDFDAHGIERSRRRSDWQQTLAMVVAEAHLCKILVAAGSNRIWFVGTKAHATVAEYAYGTLVPLAIRLADKAYYDYHMGLRREGKDIRLARGFRPVWLTSFVARIAQRFWAMRKEVTTATGNETQALMRLDNQLARVNRELEKVKKIPAMGRNDRYHAEGARQGREAADRVPLGQKGVERSTVKGVLK